MCLGFNLDLIQGKRDLEKEKQIEKGLNWQVKKMGCPGLYWANV